MVALPLVLMVAVVALNVADVAAAATETEAGTVRGWLLSVNTTVAPPAGAGWVSVTVHALVELDPRLVGVQVSEETSTGATKAIVALAELLL